MKLLFPTSDNSDCTLCLAAEDDDTSFSMAVNCHVFTPGMKAIVTDTFHCHIDYLVVTHIDVDHIDGICNVLNQMSELKIGHIIYNNLLAKKEEDQQIKSLTDFKKGQIEKLETTVPKWKPRTGHTVAAKNVLALSTLIQRNQKDAWNKNLTLITSEYLTLDELGKMSIVSPTQVVIDGLNKYILDEFVRKFYKRYSFEQGKEKGAKLFELLSLLYNQKDLLLENKVSISISTIKAKYGRPDREDISKTNRASIASAWELGDKEILLLGDVSSEIVIEGIKAYKKKSQISLSKKIHFDAIKVSRHGSDADSPEELLKHIGSSNWILCGCTGSAPHLHAIINIIYQPLLKATKKRIMYFNSLCYKNDIHNRMKINVQMLKKEGVKIDMEHINEITL